MTTQLVLRLSAALLVLTFFASPTSAQEASTDVASKLAAHMNAAAEVYDFAGAASVSRGGTTLFEGAFDLANREHDVPNTTGTIFRLGSVTKPFTAMAIFLLSEQGKLDVSDPLSKHLENVPDAWRDITIHQLLTHTSGIHNYTDLPDMMGRTVRLPASVDDVIATVRDMPLDFPPGERFSYSNTGYIVLGSIIERASGVDYETFMRQAIFEPLELASTGYDRGRTVLPGRASGYHKEGERYENAPFIDMDWPYSAGALYSTVGDLTRWCRALDEHKLLSEQSYEAMYTADTDGGNRYACGWDTGSLGGRRVLSHGGGIHGFQSIVLRIPEERVSVVVLSNVLPAQVQKIGRELAAIAVGEEVPLPHVRKVIAIDPTSFDAFVGSYQLSPGVVVSFRRDGDRYFTQLTGQDEFEIFPESEVKFFLRVVDAQLTFVLGEQGRASAVLLHQGGREKRAERMPDAAAEPAP